MVTDLKKVTMLQLIPAIDLKNGQCVRLKQGKMDESTCYSSDPVAMAQYWRDQGAKRLHLVDLDGAISGSPQNHGVIEAISRALSNELSIQIGGGIRDLKTIERYLSWGIHSVIIGTAAIKDPTFFQSACQQFSGHIMAGIDAKDHKVAITGWTEVTDLDLTTVANQLQEKGVSAIIFTDISRDGMLSGVNTRATATLAKQLQIPVIASGGISSLDDIRDLANITHTGVTGVIIGRALYEKQFEFSQALQLSGAQSSC